MEPLTKVQEYFKSKRLNVSTMKNLDNPKWIKLKMMGKVEDEEKRHFRIGGAIDAILTDPDSFKTDYTRAPGNRPGGMMGKFIEHLVASGYHDSFEESYKVAGFKTPIEGVIKKFEEGKQYQQYYKALCKAEGRTVLTDDEWEEVMHCKEYLLNSPYTRKYFMNINPDEKVLYQVPIYFEWNAKTEGKALLDGIVINYKEKTIQPFDLKTTAFSLSGAAFKRNFLKLGYYLQAAWYDEAIHQAVFRPDHTIAPADLQVCEPKAFDELGWQILPMKFVVTEKKPQHSNPARVFCCTDDDLSLGVNGGEDKQGNTYPGLRKLADAFNWHVETDQWDYPKDMVDNDGETTIGVSRFDYSSLNIS